MATPLTPVIPEGRGRAEAMRTFLARGGTMTKSGVFRSGPMKGKTIDQAKTMFEDRWASVDGRVKDKYAARARDVLSPSEKAMMYPLTRPAARPTASAPRTAAAPAFDRDGNGVPDMIQRPASSKPSSATMVPGSDAARAAALAENSGNEGFATADWRGDQAMRSAVAMSAQSYDAQGNPRPSLDSPRSPEIDQLMKPKVPPVNLTERDVKGANDVLATIGSPKRLQAGVQQLSAASPAPAPPSVPVAAPSSRTFATPATEMAGGRINPSAPRGINPLTNLPFGYQPGDFQLPGGPAIDKAAAEASIERQRQAPKTAATPAMQSGAQRMMESAGATPMMPRRAPVARTVAAPVPSAPDRYSAAQDAYQSSRLDPAKAREMDAVYAGANSRDQATITANSLKRAGRLQRTQVAPIL